MPRRKPDSTPVLNAAYMQRMSERFRIKVNKDGPIPDYAPHLGNCWLWTGCVGAAGYGFFGARAIRPGPQPASRIAKMLEVWLTTGEIITLPVGHSLTIDHLCRVRHCVRDSHLEWVTQRENMRRRPDVLTGFCRRGHAMADGNLGYRTNARPRCKACINLKGREYYWRDRDAGIPRPKYPRYRLKVDAS